MIFNQEAVDPAPCRLCGATTFQFCLNAPDFDTGQASFTLCECRSCGLVRIEPLLTEAELSRFYPSVYYGAGQEKFVGPIERLTRWLARQQAHRLLQSLNEGRQPVGPIRILDIGCGRGSLLRAFAQMGGECHGVERADFPDIEPDAGFVLHRQPLADLAFPDGHFDIVVLWHVLEHLADPGTVLTEIHRLLRPSGLLACAVPNFSSWQRRWFGPDWFHLDLPRHVHHFELPTLRHGLEERGFQIVKVETRALDQNLFGFVQSALNRLRRSRPNRLYALLRRPEGFSLDSELAGWLLAAGILSPLAGIEYMLSGLTNQGATVVMQARRC